MYISGFIGKFKGVVYIVGGYMFYVVIIFKYVFDFYVEDVFWCIVDIGWIIGYFYVIYGLLVNGVISVLFEGIFIYLDVNCLWSIVDKYKVIKFYIVLIVICLFMKFGDEFVIKYSWVFL